MYQKCYLIVDNSGIDLHYKGDCGLFFPRARARAARATTCPFWSIEGEGG